MGNPVYWIGQNGNTYVKGTNGVTDYGKEGTAANIGQALGYTLIADPVASQGGDTTVASSGGDSTAQTAAQRQANINYVNQVFDTKQAGLQSQLDSLPGQQAAGERQITGQYNLKNTRLGEDYNTGVKNLQASGNKVQAERERGLKSLSDQLRQQAMSYNNQLGAMGAGDSSASGLINFALGQQSSRNRGDLLRNASDQATAINTQAENLNTSYQRNVKDLETWKTDKLNEIAIQFANIKNQIANEMANASAERQQQLAQYDAGVTQAAIDQLTNIQQMYSQQAAQLNDMYTKMAAPSEYNLDPAQLDYSVKPIEAGTLTGLGMPAQVNPDTNPASIFRKKVDEQQNVAL